MQTEHSSVSHDELTYDDVCQCASVRNVSRMILRNSGEYEDNETILARSEEVGAGLKTVLQHMFNKTNKECGQ